MSELLPHDEWRARRVRHALVGLATLLLLLAATAPVAHANQNFSPPPLPPGNPIGRFDGFTVGPGVVGTTDAWVQVFGWTLDPDTSASIDVHIYLDGTMVASTTADQTRWDVAKAYPDYGPYHGFSTPIAVDGVGTHQVCAYAINTETGNANPSLGCRTVTVKGYPLGHLDSVTLTGPTSARVVGWAIDPNTIGPVTVEVDLDFVAVTSIVANLDRPDVGAAYPAWGAAHGFDVTIPVTPSTKDHVVEAWGANIGAGAGRGYLGAIYVKTGGTPIGNLDSVSVSSTDHSLVTVGGWTLDLDSPTTAINAAVWFFPREGSARSISLVANQVRNDVATAYPWAGANHGFAATVRLPTGTWYVCGYGINTGSGSGNPQLGNCWNVVIP
jgi:hypothetical protein